MKRWNGWGDDLAKFRTRATDARASARRRPFECSWGGLMVLDRDDARAAEKAQRLGAPPGAVVGGPTTVARALGAYGEAGADWVILGPVDAHDPENARRLGAQVRPLLPS